MRQRRCADIWVTARHADREVVKVQHGQSGRPDPRSSLTLKQRQVMRLLARGASITDAARKAGVNEERARQWTTTPTFRDALSRERVEPTRSSVAEVLREPSEPKEEIPRSLSARRSKAIDLLVSGTVSITEAAQRSGYSRQHLSQLLHRDLHFQAEYQQRLTEEHIRRSNVFWTMYDRSGRVLQQSLDEGDPRTAMEIFKLGSRGVTDINHPYWDAQGRPKPPPPPLSMLEPDLATSESEDLTCEECGLEARSRRGLNQHRNAKHRDLDKR
jgi:transposase-like protein